VPWGAPWIRATAGASPASWAHERGQAAPARGLCTGRSLRSAERGLPTAQSVAAGPVCPVEQIPPDPQCAPRPVAGATIVATNTGGQEVGRTTSGADGSYELIVGETGTVLVTAQPVVGLAMPPAPVSVGLSSPSEVERIDLEYDTGIR